jgi:single-strand DNA-binding protein
MILTALARLGKDTEVRFTPSGEPVANLALAVNYGRKGDDGNRPTQWIDASLWGKRAESLAPHLTKGKLVYVVIEEPHIETYQTQNGQGAKLVGRVMNIEFAGGGDRQQQGGSSGGYTDRPAQGQQGQGRAQQAPAAGAQRSSGGFGDFDDEDIPF